MAEFEKIYFMSIDSIGKTKIKRMNLFRLLF